MTNAQKWVAVFLVLFIILFVLAKLTDNDNSGIDKEDYQPSTQTEQEATQDGMTLLANTGCTGCHGDDLKGTELAPALIALNDNWSRDGLINYLRNPASYSAGERFDELKTKYEDVIMPAYNNIEVKELGRMADFLLQQN